MNATKSGSALPACLLQLESQAAPQIEVILHGFAERVHRTPPGQGKASVRNALMSTLQYIFVVCGQRCPNTPPISLIEAP